MSYPELVGWQVLQEKAVAHVRALVDEVKSHITNERLILMAQLEESNARLTAAVQNQIKQVADALRELAASDAEKADLRAQLEAQVSTLDALSSDLEADDPAPAPEPPAEPTA